MRQKDAPVQHPPFHKCFGVTSQQEKLQKGTSEPRRPLQVRVNGALEAIAACTGTQSSLLSMSDWKVYCIDSKYLFEAVIAENVRARPRGEATN